MDPGGYNLPIADYQPLLALWREGGMTLRVRYSLSAPRRDRELEDFKELTQVLPMGFGDGLLRFNGIGENAAWGLYNNDSPTPAQKEALTEVLRWAVSRGMTATFHWHNDRAVHHLLEVLERVNAETPVAKLRWSIAHLNDAFAGEPPAHEGDGNRLAGAERVLLPRRGVPRPARHGRGTASRRRSSARSAWALSSAAAPMRTG